MLAITGACVFFLVFFGVFSVRVPFFFFFFFFFFFPDAVSNFAVLDGVQKVVIVIDRFLKNFQVFLLFDLFMKALA